MSELDTRPDIADQLQRVAAQPQPSQHPGRPSQTAQHIEANSQSQDMSSQPPQNSANSEEIVSPFELLTQNTTVKRIPKASRFQASVAYTEALR